MDRAYSTASPRVDRDASVLEAVRWASRRPGADATSGPVLWLPHRDDIDELPETRRLVRAGLRVLADRPGRGPRPTPHSGPVVAYGIGMTRLAELEPYADPVVLVGAFVEGLAPHDFEASMAFHQPWIDAFDPEHLSGPTITSHKPLIADGVLAAAFTSFTSSTFGGRTMYRSDDGGRVTSGLMLLHDAGHRFNPDELFAAALQRGWPGAQALRLRAVAAELAAGRRKRPAAHYGPGALDRWREVAQAPQ